jgi:hypothetical protein
METAMADRFDRWFRRDPLPRSTTLREAVRRHYSAFGFEVTDTDDDLMVQQGGVAVLVRLLAERQAVEADVIGLMEDAKNHRARRCILYAHDISDPGRRLAAAEGVELVGPDSIRRILQAVPAA